MTSLAEGDPRDARHPAGALRGLPFAVTAALAALPWLNPFAPGPTPTVMPWLTSFACALAAWVLATAQGAGVRVGALAAGAVLVAWGLLGHQASPLDTFAWLGAVTLIVLAASVADVPELLAGAQSGLLAAAVLSAALALLQYLGLGEPLAPWVSRAGVGEAYANLRQPNQFATLCAIGMALVLWPAIPLPRALRLMAVVLLAAGSAASVSRTGLLQIVALAVLVLLWRDAARRERVLVMVMGAIAYFAASWLLPQVLEALTGSLPARTLLARLGGGEGCSSRKILWANVLHLITLRPWVGWGFGELDYAHFMTLYDGPRFCEILDNAHNLPLHLAVEAGVPLALLVCLAAAFWVFRQRPWAEQQVQRQRAWALLAVIGVHSLLEYPLWYGPFQFAFGIALGCLTTGAKSWQWPLLSRGLVVAVLAASIGYAAWDYARVSQIYLSPSKRLAAWADDPLANAQRSWLFAAQARFAALTLDTPSRQNAARMLPEALETLHYSPEPRVVERAIGAAVYLHRDEEAMALLARFRAAYPKEAQAWSRRHALPAQD